MDSLAGLVYEGRVDEAVEVAREMQAEAVSQRLLSDPVRYSRSPAAVSEFLHAWYSTLTSVHQRADAVLAFGSMLASVPIPIADDRRLADRVISASETWLDREVGASRPGAEGASRRIGRVAGGLLADLVYAGRLDDAIDVARDFHPRAIHRMLFQEDHRWLQDEAPAGIFVRRWFSTLESAYLRAEAAHTFSDTFMTELAPVPDGEYIGASMKTEALRQLLTTVSRACSGAEVNDWATSPARPLPAESAAQWREIGRILSRLDFPPPVPTAAARDD